MIIIEVILAIATLVYLALIAIAVWRTKSINGPVLLYLLSGILLLSMLNILKATGLDWERLKEYSRVITITFLGFFVGCTVAFILRFINIDKLRTKLIYTFLLVGGSFYTFSILIAWNQIPIIFFGYSLFIIIFSCIFILFDNFSFVVNEDGVKFFLDKIIGGVFWLSTILGTSISVYALILGLTNTNNPLHDPLHDFRLSVAIMLVGYLYILLGVFWWLFSPLYQKLRRLQKLSNLNLNY